MTPRLSSAAAPDGTRIGLGSALRDPVFAKLYLAEAQSAVGDQLARVALAILVFRSTGSISATAAAYAATLLPAIFGGAILGRLGDRWSRRSVMIGCDVARAAIFAAMSFAGMPVAVVVALVVVAVTLGPVFSAAQVSALAERLGPELFRSANGLRLATSQITQVAGFVAGGVLVAWIGPRFALALNAVSFSASALLVVTIGAAGAARRIGPDEASPLRAGWSMLWTDLRLRRLVVLTLLIGLFVVPEGLAVPFGQAAGVSTAQIGVLFGAGAGGGALGAVMLLRLRRGRARVATCGYLAACSGVPLVVSGFVTDWRLTAVLWLLSGVFTAYMVDATTLLVQAIPDDRRAGLVGILGAGVLASEGLSVIAFGALAQVIGAAAAVAVAGGLGALIAMSTLVSPTKRAHTPSSSPTDALDGRRGLAGRVLVLAMPSVWRTHKTTH